VVLLQQTTELHQGALVVALRQAALRSPQRDHLNPAVELQIPLVDHPKEEVVLQSPRAVLLKAM
jgi:hypothetical protein